MMSLPVRLARSRFAGAQVPLRTLAGVPGSSSNSRRVLLVQPLASASLSNPSTSTPIWDIRMLYDGECPLCMKEVNFLRSRDAGKGRIDFVDIASPSYRAEDNAGITFQQAMERIHAIRSDGTILVDVEVFQALYEAVGLGWVYAVTKNPTVLAAANAVYGVWAKYRTQLTGREAMEVILQRRAAAQAAAGGALGGSLCREADGSTAEACAVPQAVGAAEKTQVQ